MRTWVFAVVLATATSSSACVDLGGDGDQGHGQEQGQYEGQEHGVDDGTDHGGGDGGGDGGGEYQGEGEGDGEDDVVWPIANTAEPDADEVSSGFGPRDLSGDYDFHAGIDIKLPEGTPIRAIKAGTVEQVTLWDGQSSSGNRVLIDHGGGEKSAYLHLSSISAKLGEAVEPGTVIGRSGSTGANTSHLHLNYMLGLGGAGMDERLAHNPLELLPHAPMPTPVAYFEADRVVVEMVIQPNTVQSLILEGPGPDDVLSLDYADVFALGNPDRDEPVQFGIGLGVERPNPGYYELSLIPMAPAFSPERVRLYDFDGELLLDAHAE